MTVYQGRYFLKSSTPVVRALNFHFGEYPLTTVYVFTTRVFQESKLIEFFKMLFVPAE